MRLHGLLFATILGLTACLTACQSSVEQGPGGGGQTNAGGGEPGGAGGEGGGSGGEGGNRSGGSGGSGGSVGPACQAPEGAAVFELGTGERCFERLSPGAEVPLMNGPQGGYHLWMAIGCEDCDDPVELRFGVNDPATGEPLPETGTFQQMVPLEGAAWPQRAGLIVHMPGIAWAPEEYPPPAKGTHVVLWAKAYDGDAVLHEAEVEVVIGDTVSWDPCAEDPENPICQTG